MKDDLIWCPDLVMNPSQAFLSAQAGSLRSQLNIYRESEGVLSDLYYECFVYSDKMEDSLASGASEGNKERNLVKVLAKRPVLPAPEVAFKLKTEAYIF